MLIVYLAICFLIACSATATPEAGAEGAETEGGEAPAHDCGKCLPGYYADNTTDWHGGYTCRHESGAGAACYKQTDCKFQLKCIGSKRGTQKGECACEGRWDAEEFICNRCRRAPKGQKAKFPEGAKYVRCVPVPRVKPTNEAHVAVLVD